MFRDLLDGFVARGWSGALDFDTLLPCPSASSGKTSRSATATSCAPVASATTAGSTWPCSFQASVDGAALRMLGYTALLWQRLAPRGATEAWKS